MLALLSTTTKSEVSKVNLQIKQYQGLGAKNNRRNIQIPLRYQLNHKDHSLFQDNSEIGEEGEHNTLQTLLD